MDTLEELRAQSAGCCLPHQPCERKPADQDAVCVMKHAADEIERLRAALSKLVTTLTAVENSPSFQGIWPYLHAHGYKYQGPDWRDALADARLAQARHEQQT